MSSRAEVLVVSGTALAMLALLVAIALGALGAPERDDEAFGPELGPASVDANPGARRDAALGGAADSEEPRRGLEAAPGPVLEFVGAHDDEPVSGVVVQLEEAWATLVSDAMGRCALGAALAAAATRESAWKARHPDFESVGGRASVGSASPRRVALRARRGAAEVAVVGKVICVEAARDRPPQLVAASSVERRGGLRRLENGGRWKGSRVRNVSRPIPLVHEGGDCWSFDVRAPRDRPLLLRASWVSPARVGAGGEATSLVLVAGARLEPEALDGDPGTLTLRLRRSEAMLGLLVEGSDGVPDGGDFALVVPRDAEGELIDLVASGDLAGRRLEIHGAATESVIGSVGAPGFGRREFGPGLAPGWHRLVLAADGGRDLLVEIESASRPSLMIVDEAGHERRDDFRAAEGGLWRLRGRFPLGARLAIDNGAELVHLGAVERLPERVHSVLGGGPPVELLGAEAAAGDLVLQTRSGADWVEVLPLPAGATELPRPRGPSPWRLLRRSATGEVATVDLDVGIRTLAAPGAELSDG